MSPDAIPKIKERLSQVTLEQAQGFARAAMAL
jgi:hypothetical protein